MEITNNKYNTMPEQVQENKDNINKLAKQITELNDFNFMGQWISENEYKVNDIVIYNNSIYVVIQDIDNSIIPPAQDIQHFYLAVSAPSGSNPNLLINSDFRINQRGEDTYTTGFTVDRWRILETCTVSPLTNGGINILTTNSANALFYRMEVADFEVIRGKTCTISMKCTNIIMGKVDVQIGDNSINWLTENASQGLNTSGIFKMTFNVPENATATTRIIIHTTGATNANVEWVKLEIGSVATEFTPKPYAEELSMCQRYYINAHIQSLSYATYSTTVAYPELALPATMRTIPTIIVKTYPNNRGQGLSIKTTSITAVSLRANGVMLSITGDFVTNQPYVLTDGEVELDAEIY